MTETEMLDVVDENGVPTGAVKPRALIHRDGDRHRTVHIWIVNGQGDILFQKRSAAKESFPDLWDVSAAGHVESGETSMAAAIKEVREELGLHIEPQDLRLLFSQRSTSIQNQGRFVDNEISDVYLVRREIDIKDIHPQESEVSGVRYVGRGEFARLAENRDPGFTPHDEEYRRLYESILNQKE